MFTPFWFSKHQHQVPCLFIAFFDLNATADSAQDEQLKADINAARNALSRSGFRVRFAVILLSDQSILHVPELESRLASIRRATTLDPKNGLFFMPPMSSQNEIATFVQSIMATLQPACVEYYRDLTKHARRKKARGGPPPFVHSSVGSTLSTSAWSVRYEIKQGVFAEFRQEMDVAERHYSTAIEELFSSEGGVLETTNSWSPRWDEARLLCDAVALRVIRSQLWTGQTTGAAQSWQNYKLRMHDLVDRRGKGSDTYSFCAWQARWASIMAELIGLADIASLRRSAAADRVAMQQYASPERPTERLPPSSLLHHPGYWLRLVAEGIRTRWQKAMVIPEDDRVPPSQSPASAVASRSRNYDVYLVPDPHEEAGGSVFDHVKEIAMVTARACEEFEARRQVRMSELLKLGVAETLLNSGRYQDAMDALLQLWEASSWRKEDWREPFVKLLQLLYQCCNQTKSQRNAALLPVLTWEQLSIDAGPTDAPDDPQDFLRCLDSWDIDNHVEVQLHDEHRLSPIASSFAFRHGEGHVGEPCDCQLILNYHTTRSKVPIQLSKIEFGLGEKTILVKHKACDDPSAAGGPTHVHETQEGILEATSDLTLTPSCERTLNITLVLREAQVYSMTRLKAFIETPKFRLMHEYSAEAVRPGTRWSVQGENDVESVLLARLDTKSINVLPKAPKMQIVFHGLRKQYYTDEHVSLGVALKNGEDDDVEAIVEAQVISQAGDVAVTSKWKDQQHDEHIHIVDNLAAAATHTSELLMQGPSEASSFRLTLDLRYTLKSDPTTPLRKAVALELDFVTAFEAKFTFAPRLHADPWPSYFDPSGQHATDPSDSVSQNWKLGAQISSLVEEALKIERVELLVLNMHSETSCDIHEPLDDTGHMVHPRNSVTSAFELTTRKASFDDRQPSVLDLSLMVTWSRNGDAEPSQNTIAVPRLTIPASEPRVLCTINHDASDSSSTRVRYHLENPSTHFLTFALTMEASEDFAMSGSKYRTLSLAPLSRHHVEYHLLLHEDIEDGSEGVWVSPRLQVVDSYYQKTLRVHPGGDGVRVDGPGRDICVWIGGRGQGS